MRESLARGEKATQLVDLSDSEAQDVKAEPKLENSTGMNLSLLCSGVMIIAPALNCLYFLQ